jgi:hypothetical protein
VKDVHQLIVSRVERESDEESTADVGWLTNQLSSAVLQLVYTIESVLSVGQLNEGHMCILDC